VSAHEELPDFEHLKWTGNGRLASSAQNAGRLPDKTEILVCVNIDFI
jgi:hypothetical protein